MSRPTLALIALLLLCPRAAAADAPPIRYEDSFLAKPLSDELRARILADARANQPKGAAIWYVHVLYNYYPLLHPTEHALGVRVYYTPTTVTPRLRRGHTLSYGGLLPGPQLGRYVDVSPPDAPFDPAKPPPAALPAVTSSPFFGARDNRDDAAKAARPFTDADLVSLVDFIRPVIATVTRRPSPLRSIHLRDDGTIEVWTGLDSSGHILRAKRTPTGGFERTDKGMTLWRS